MALVPTLTSPPTPPAVGDPGTIGARSGWYLVAISIALAGVVVLWWLASWLRSSTSLGAPARQAMVGLGALVAVAALMLALPLPQDPIEIPGRLLWEFRLASMGTQLLLWAGIAGVNGRLWQRATTPASAPAARSVPA